jgi:hypothetical protein
LTCCRRTRFSASSVALALKREARIPRISLNRSLIRMRAYAVRLLRLRRIEFSVHTGHWTKMHRSLAKFSESEASNHTPSLADFTTTTPELKFSVHTAGLVSPRDLWRSSQRAQRFCHADAGMPTIKSSRLVPTKINYIVISIIYEFAVLF